MQPVSGGDGGGGGGNEVGKRGGLQRYRSAPATWLEALLEPETDVVFDPSPILLTSNKPPPHPQSQGLQIPPTTPPPPTTPSSSVQLKSGGGGGGGGGGGRFAGDPGLFETAGGGGNFLRQNSSPAEFLSQICSDGYLSGFGVSSGYDYLSSPLDVSQSTKRPRDGESENSAAKFSSLLKGEQSGQLRSAGGSLDAEMEQLMEDLVPCKVRAKRGFATHPRSIAERVRRTRISDRIRKLQDLVPNMDKQTNTADMLEEAVEYVKLLQKQIQELREHQKNCTCATTEE